MQMIGARRDDSQSSNGWGQSNQPQNHQQYSGGGKPQSNANNEPQWTLTTIFRFRVYE